MVKPQKARPIPAFAHIPKTGGTTVVDMLQRHFGLRHMAVHHRSQVGPYTKSDLEFDLGVHRLTRSISGHTLCPFVDFGRWENQLRWYTFVRDPTDRLLSHYQHQFHRTGGRYKVPFEEWLRSYRRGNWMVRMIAGREDLQAAKTIIDRKGVFVGMLERFDESLVLLRLHLGIPGLCVDYGEPKNPGGRQARSTVRNNMEAHREAIAATNRLDEELYKYVRENIWPAQVERLGRDSESAFDRAASPGAGAHARRLTYRIYRNLVYKPILALDRLR